MKKLLLLIAIITLLISCKKDIFTPYGEWETVNSVGYKWEYAIEKNGQFCKSLPDQFPLTSFCHDYQMATNGLNMTVFAPDEESWVFTPVCEDVADVSVTYQNGEVVRFIIKRK